MSYAEKNISCIPLKLIKKFEPRSAWLLHDSFYHGVDHMARVFIMQELICDKLELQGMKVNRKAVRWAAMTHDVGRVHDWIDLAHGRRSAEWIKQNLADKMSPELLDTVTYIVHWHVPSDDEAPVMTTELQILKDADALDRVRLGDLDARYLRTAAAPSLIGVAENLFRTYETVRATRAFDAVILAAQRIGVVSRA